MEKLLNQILSLIQLTKSLDESWKNQWAYKARGLFDRNEEKQLILLLTIFKEDKIKQDIIDKQERKISEQFVIKKKDFDKWIKEFEKSYRTNFEKNNEKMEQDKLDDLLDDINNA